MYTFNMSYQHWPVVQGLESTPVDNIQIECVQQQKVSTVAARQQCLKHLALLHMFAARLLEWAAGSDAGSRQ